MFVWQGRVLTTTVCATTSVCRRGPGGMRAHAQRATFSLTTESRAKQQASKQWAESRGWCRAITLNLLSHLTERMRHLFLMLPAFFRKQSNQSLRYQAEGLPCNRDSHSFRKTVLLSGDMNRKGTLWIRKSVSKRHNSAK